jgi:uncharacterized membrane protein YoaK (UPF0700 family)
MFMKDIILPFNIGAILGGFLFMGVYSSTPLVVWIVANFICAIIVLIRPA